MVTTGVRFEQDQNTAFDQTGLAVPLGKNDILRLCVAGLAEGWCAVLDECRERFDVFFKL